MIFVDTGFLLAVSQSRDALHSRATAWAKVVTDPLLTTEYVLWETVNAFSKPVDRGKAHLLLRHIRSATGYEVVPASTALFNSGLQLHAERPDKEWSLTDCVSFIVMGERGILGALTPDHHFEQAGFDALLCRDPPQVTS